MTFLITHALAFLAGAICGTAAILLSAAGAMNGVGCYMHKAPGLPSKFDKVTPR